MVSLVICISRGLIFTLVEHDRAPLQVSLAGASLEIRNSLAEGIGAIFSAVSLFLCVLLSYGLPLLFWLALLFWPARILYRRLRPASPALPAA